MMNMLSIDGHSVLSAHQPNYWPYPGLIGKIIKSECFMYVTNVQFEKKSWQKRNRIRTKEGWSYIQVPTVTKGRFDQNICEVEIDNTVDWCTKTMRSISLLYQKAPYYREYKDFLEDLYTRGWTSLSELDIYIMNWILSTVRSNTKVYYDADFFIEGKKTTMLIDMCKKIGCDTYMSNLGSSAYVKIEEFVNNDLNHLYIDYVSPKYRQMYANFEPCMSILDMLMNCGTEKTREILMDDGNYRFSKLNEELV